MSETKPPYLKAEKQSPINKASAMIEDYLIGLKKEFGDLHRAVRDIEAENQDLRRENGEFLDKLHEKDLEIKELRANLENEKQHVLDMREGVRLGGELARKMEQIKEAFSKLHESGKSFSAETNNEDLREKIKRHVENENNMWRVLSSTFSQTLNKETP